MLESESWRVDPVCEVHKLSLEVEKIPCLVNTKIKYLSSCHHGSSGGEALGTVFGVLSALFVIVGLLGAVFLVFLLP